MTQNSKNRDLKVKDGIPPSTSAAVKEGGHLKKKRKIHHKKTLKSDVSVYISN